MNADTQTSSPAPADSTPEAQSAPQTAPQTEAMSEAAPGAQQPQAPAESGAPDRTEPAAEAIQSETASAAATPEASPADASAPAQPSDATPPADSAPALSAPALSAEVNAEIEAAMAEMGADMDAAMGGAQASPKPAKAKLRGPRVVQGGREHRSGTVVSVGPNDVFVEFGPKELGVLERPQFKEGTDKAVDLPNVGDQLEVVVQRFDANEGILLCVLPGTVQKADWELLEPGQNVEARVSGTNKGGLELEVAGHRAFMPASQVDVNRIPDLSIFVGEKLECRVQRIDRSGRGNIVLSRRELVKEERAKAAEKLREALNEGDTVEGTVRKIMPFGAFIDLGGVDGLVHISDLSHDRVGMGEKAVAKYVSEGQKVRVQILSIDWDANRIGLGMKQLEADPFEAAAAEVAEGATLTGKVTKILDFGCFVEVAPGVEGLVHISEIDYRRINKVEDAVQAGEVVQVKVLKIDPASRKVSLSIKATKEAPAQQGGGRGRGRGRGERDDRSPDEILKETPQLRRLREQAQKKARDDKSGGGGLGDAGGLGIGLGDLKL
ncbi:MAG: S1 RNA-binding domain-containing protein [Planctomycetota bacterium]